MLCPVPFQGGSFIDHNYCSMHRYSPYELHMLQEFPHIATTSKNSQHSDISPFFRRFPGSATSLPPRPPLWSSSRLGTPPTRETRGSTFHISEYMILFSKFAGSIRVGSGVFWLRFCDGGGLSLACETPVPGLQVGRAENHEYLGSRRASD